MKNVSPKIKFYSLGAKKIDLSKINYSPIVKKLYNYNKQI